MAGPSTLHTLFYVYEGCACMDVCVTHVCLMSLKVRRGHQTLGTGVRDSFKLLCVCWDLNQGPLEEQPVLH